VSECISFQSLNQTVRQLDGLRELYLPRCSSRDERREMSMNIRWPPLLRHLSLSGSVSGPFLWDMLRQPGRFPPTLSSLSILHCVGLDYQGVKSFLCSLSSLTVVELRDLPAIKHGRCTYFPRFGTEVISCANLVPLAFSQQCTGLASESS
jgi:hypothetical protein